MIVNHIVLRDGEARIEGKDYLKAEMVARMYVQGDYSIEEVMAQYALTAAEVHSAIAYYYDHQAALDEMNGRALDEIAENAMTIEKFKQKLEERSGSSS